MIVRLVLRGLLVLAVFVLLPGINEHAKAGGMFVLEDSVDIGGRSGHTFAPNEPVSVSFDVRDYQFGTDKYEYAYFAVVPAREKLRKVSLDQASRWKLLYMRMNPSSSTQGLQRLELTFKAPPVPGRYMLIYNHFPIFRSDAFDATESPGRALEPRVSARQSVLRGAIEYPDEFKSFVSFNVSATVPQEDTLTVYMRADGEQPAFANIKGGISNKPLELSWFVGPEFKLDKKHVLFRYKMFPTDDDWFAWTEETSIKYHFLPKGALSFRVEARYDDGKRAFSSQPARFNFLLLDYFVAKASAATLSKGPLDKTFEVDGKVIETKISFDTVYAKSRALIIGIYQFDDKLSFREFPADKIQRDVDTLETALNENGFEVIKLFKERVTRDEIVSAIEKLVSDSQQNDRLFIYFSSHGFIDSNSASDGFIATSDCKMKEPSVKCYRLADLEYQAKRALEGKRVRQVLMAVDSCFSGLGVISKSAGVPDFSKLAAAQGAYMLTAGMADLVAEIDPRLGMSTFTHFLSRGLRGEANMLDKNGIITLTELFLYVQYNVAKQSDSKQIPMLGRLRGNGEMLFRPKYISK